MAPCLSVSRFRESRPARCRQLINARSEFAGGLSYSGRNVAHSTAEISASKGEFPFAPTGPLSGASASPRPFRNDGSLPAASTEHWFHLRWRSTAKSQGYLFLIRGRPLDDR